MRHFSAAFVAGPASGGCGHRGFSLSALACAFVIPWLGLLASRPATARQAYRAAPAATFEHRAAPPMTMPTDVAIGTDGVVYVADGFNDRILKFTAAGEFIGEIKQVGKRSLNAPIGVSVDSIGRLWVADTGNRRVVALREDGTVDREIDPDSPGGDGNSNVTDIVLTPDARTLWMVDDNHHRLIRLNLADKTRTTFGGKGELLGQLHYPFMPALGPDNSLYVTDVINARVAHYDPDGTPLAPLGSLGVNLGQLYRPKGLAIDGSGNIWVADGSLGVIQIFKPDGALIDVLRDGDGKPLHFRSPTGMAFDKSGALYVTELAADRVLKLTITRAGGAAAAIERDTTHAESQPARSCTVCHIEWMGRFAEGIGTVLMEAPKPAPGQPIVSRPETCLSCHDGSVVDSRRHVWRDHSHMNGVEPSARVKVPQRLPLVDGKLACRTCHSAHATGEPTGDMKKAVFLRMPNESGELCISCHGDHTRGAQPGTHPTGKMPFPIPQVLIDHGAKAGPSPSELTCRGCHTPHGASKDGLLVFAEAPNQLCRACHDQLRPGMFGEAAQGTHPLHAAAGAERATAVHAMGTRLSGKGELLCLSCHQLHGGKTDRYMLADELTDGRLCLRCHADKNSINASAHDLRRGFPNEKNQLGMTTQVGGQCSACHSVHQPARAPEASELDPDGGRCITCHQKGRSADAKQLGKINHPHVKCAVCHDAHDPENNSFLRQPPADLCIECHEQAEVIAGAHAFEDRDDIKNPRGQSAAEVGSCLICHSPHHGVAKPLWGASTEAPLTVREKCTVCHQKGGLAQARPAKKFNHTLDCTSCHNPHGDSDENPPLLIVDPPVQNLCMRCHDYNGTVVGGPHDVKKNPAAWPKKSLERTDRCLACHRPHADTRAGLFANGLAPGVKGPDAKCLACHPNAKWRTAGSDIAAMHPQKATDLDPDDEDLPLVAVDGDDEEYRIGCRTCHNPHHGAGPPAKMVRAEEGDPTASLCAECHDVGHRGLTGHSAASLTAAGLKAESCKPCHSVHADPAHVGKRLMWTPALDTSALLPAAQRCLGCHASDGPAKRPMIVTHPQVAMSNPTAPDAAGFLPLFAADGSIDPRGGIACTTCHVPHGRDPAAGGSGDDTADELPGNLQRSLRLELRPFLSPNVCNTCHGLDARRRFLYFHDPARRSGPLRRAGRSILWKK